ncbi:MAG: Cys-tRNA(Pro) deacylase [Myxococcota bacterium]
MKTNASRILDELGIAHELREYPVDLEDLRAETVAEKVGLPAEQVFKTLLLRGESSGPLFAVVAGDAELDLKALAKLSGNKSVEMVPLKEVVGLTGYVRGGVTVLGAKKAFPAFCDEEIGLYEVVSISAGARGTQILLAPSDYLRATAAKVGGFARR